MVRAIVSEFYRPFLRKAISAADVDVVYWIRSTQYPGAINHRTTDAKFGIPAPGVGRKIGATPGIVWNYIERNQPMLFEMMEGLCLPYRDRQSLYRLLVNYWYSILVNFKPDVYIMPVSPHGVYDYLIYSLCRAMGIKTAIFRYTALPDSVYITKMSHAGVYWMMLDVKPSIKLTEYLQSVRGHYSSGVPKITKVRLHDQKPKTEYVSNLAKLCFMFTKNPETENHRLRNKATINQLIRAITSPRKRRSLEAHYRKISRYPDLSNKPYIYVALHSQPERSTVPDAGIWRDQLIMIENLRKRTNCRLYVKEHPGHFTLKNADLSRSKRYYDYIASLPNTILVPVEMDTFELTDESEAVATVAGTAGWEAIVRGKPAYVFAETWYRQCLMDHIPADTFAASVEAQSIRGYTTEVHERVSGLTEEENIKNLAGGLKKWIRKNFSSK